MRNKIFNFIDNAPVYNYGMIVVILLSLVPLMTKQQSQALHALDLATAGIFIIDYLLRWLTADLRPGKSPAKAFAMYPLTPMAIIDLLSILPSLLLINPAFKALRVLRLLRALRVFRIVRYSRNVQILVNVFEKQKQALVAVGCLAVGYVYVSALVMFQIEPDTFEDFYDAIYWATVSLTTVGYGDIFATSDTGRLITMISAFMGIAIVALPAGIITAGYMEEIQKK